MRKIVDYLINVVYGTCVAFIIIKLSDSIINYKYILLLSLIPLIISIILALTKGAWKKQKRASISFIIYFVLSIIVGYFYKTFFEIIIINILLSIIAMTFYSLENNNKKEKVDS